MSEISKVISTTNDLTLATSGKYCDKNIKISLEETSKANLIAENIKKDVTILGVTGTLEQGEIVEETETIITPTDTYRTQSDLTYVVNYDYGMYTNDDFTNELIVNLQNGSVTFNNSDLNLTNVGYFTYVEGSIDTFSGSNYDVITSVKIGTLQASTNVLWELYAAKAHGCNGYFVWVKETTTIPTGTTINSSSYFSPTDATLGRNYDLTGLGYPFKYVLYKNPDVGENIYTFNYVPNKCSLYNSIFPEYFTYYVISPVHGGDLTNGIIFYTYTNGAQSSFVRMDDGLSPIFPDEEL